MSTKPDFAAMAYLDLKKWLTANGATFKGNISREDAIALAEETWPKVAFNGADPALFDHDQNGAPGGSAPDAEKTPEGGPAGFGGSDAPPEGEKAADAPSGADGEGNPPQGEPAADQTPPPAPPEQQAAAPEPEPEPEPDAFEETAPPADANDPPPQLPERVRMRAPEGATGASHGGTEYEVDGEGFVHVKPEAIGSLQDHGFVVDHADDDGE